MPPSCPYSPLAVTHCPCGKRSLTDPTDHSYFSGNTKLIRSACTDPVPTCTSPCGKPLEGCAHFCSTTCHTGPCTPCAVPVVRPCRCGSTTRTLTCGTMQAEMESTTFLCSKPCGSLRACGHHTCTRLCCPLANLANPIGKGKKRATTNNIASEVVDVDGWHQCDIICGRTLSCGNHQCEERDHRGPCPPCFRSSFEEVCLIFSRRGRTLTCHTDHLPLWTYCTGTPGTLRDAGTMLLPVRSTRSTMWTPKGSPSMPRGSDAVSPVCLSYRKALCMW